MNWTSRSLPGKDRRSLGQQVTVLLSVRLSVPTCASFPSPTPH